LKGKASSPGQWPGIQAILGCSAIAALVVAIDTYFSVQEGYLAQPPGYDGISYMFYARAAYLLVLHGHLKTAVADLNALAPLWTAAMTFQYLVLGDGTWQAFLARFWAVALLLILVYWLVRARAAHYAIGAVVLTAMLPMVSAGVRSASWEFLSGRANFGGDWSLDDLRPDFLAIVLVLWSIAPLAEHNRAPRQSTYLVSAAFAAAAVLAKPSTAPVSLAAWVSALSLVWFWNRKRPATLRMTAFSVGLFAALLLPWAIRSGGAAATVTRLYATAVTFRDAYATNVGLLQNLAYYPVLMPSQLGQLEVLAVVIGTLVLTIAALRGRLDRSAWIYAGSVVLFYAGFTLTSNKNLHVGEWISLSLWIFFLAGGTSMVATKWPSAFGGRAPFALGAIAMYVLAIYSLGAIALANWPANEKRSNVQLQAVTTELAGELARYVSVDQCFAYAPGPGWPGSLVYLLLDSDGRAPGTTPIDVDPTTMTTNQYVDMAKNCPAVIAYREDIGQVAKMFFAPPVRQPYLRAVADWVRSPGSGYALDRTWRMSDLAPSGAHPLGRYQGVSLTVDLYIRT
jgi:hypothetical protein